MAHRALASVVLAGHVVTCGSTTAGTTASQNPPDGRAQAASETQAQPQAGRSVRPSLGSGAAGRAEPGVPSGLLAMPWPEAAKDDACPATTDELPASSTYSRDDPRLEEAALLVADKSARRLILFEHGALEGCWRIGLGFAPRGHKRVEGDGKTPEGWYRTSDKPWSSFDDAIAVHYPNAQDARAALEDERISRRARDRIVAAIRDGKMPPQRTALGGAILIHGGGSARDWTLGCIALDDSDLGDLRGSLPASMRTHLLILP